jgi:peptidoglycan/xylan/chitin deacetylase (PgdA/CDA1 family)
MKLIYLLFLLTLATSLRTTAQEVALTFDDAPTFDSPLFTYEQRAAKIRGHLAEHNVKAAFFVITSSIDETNTKQLKAYTREGHVLANHSHSHYSPSRVHVDTYIQDIMKADSILRTWSDVQPWYRYPYLNEGLSTPKRDSIRSVLKSLNVANGYVTVDNYDWFINSALIDAARKDYEINYERLKAFYLDHVYQSLLFYDSVALKTIGRSPKHVLLLHESDLTALFLGDLISMLRSKGWKIISPADAYKDPIAERVPDVLFNGQGRIGAIAFSLGIPADQLVQPSEDEVWLEEKLTEQKVFLPKH